MRKKQKKSKLVSWTHSQHSSAHAYTRTQVCGMPTSVPRPRPRPHIYWTGVWCAAETRKKRRSPTRQTKGANSKRTHPSTEHPRSKEQAARTKRTSRRALHIGGGCENSQVLFARIFNKFLFHFCCFSLACRCLATRAALCVRYCVIVMSSSLLWFSGSVAQRLRWLFCLSARWGRANLLF